MKLADLPGFWLYLMLLSFAASRAAEFWEWCERWKE